MRIAVLTQYFPSSAQPWAGHSAYQTLRVLARRHDVHAFYPEARYPKLFQPKSRTYGDLDPSWQPADVAATYIPYSVLPLVSRPFNGWMISRALFAAVRDYKPDVILSYVVYPDGYAATRIGKRLGVPVVLKAIGSDLNRISDPICGMHTVRALRDAAFVTTVSKDLLLTARAMGAEPNRSVEILNGCDTSVFHPRDRSEARAALGVPQDAEAVVYVGRMDVRKGLNELVAATASLARRRPKLLSYFVGEGPDRPALEAAAVTNNATAFVRFIDPTNTRGVAQWMAAANLVTLPSYKEGCPNVVIEALAAGRPVVATDVGGIPELMDDTCGRLIAAHNVEALEEGLDQVLAASWDETVIASQHSRSWDDSADAMETVLKRAVFRQMQSKT